MITHKKNIAQSWFVVSAIWLFSISVIVFPKAGFKVGNIPITFGYMFIFSIAFFLLFFFLYAGRVSRQVLLCYVLWAFFGSISLAIIFFNGIKNPGFAFSHFINFILFPFIFLFIFSRCLSYDQWHSYANILTKCVVIICFYGILLFLYKALTGSFFEVPYLTVNVDDLGALDEKHIRRGDFFKLISTYNNGNIFGVCVLMLLPIVFLHSRSMIIKAVILISLVLTLSRTIWLGLILYSLLLMRDAFEKRPFYIIVYLVSITFFLTALFAAMSFFGMSDASFLFDAELGGRREALDFISPSFLPSIQFDYVSEITYASMLNSFGILGLAVFVVAFFSFLLFNLPRESENYAYFVAARRGLIIYVFCCFSDGATLLIPVMAIYWTLVALVSLRPTKNILKGNA